MGLIIIYFAGGIEYHHRTFHFSQLNYVLGLVRNAVQCEQVSFHCKLHC